MAPPKILVISRNYPNHAMAQLGLWVEWLVKHTGKLCEIRVLAPVPYCPPLPRCMRFSHFRRIPAHEHLDGIEVSHPRFVTGPRYLLHSYEADSYYWSLRRHVEQLRRAFPFDLIHAHLSYPEGVVAARLAQSYKVPVLITEHAPWLPWMEEYPRVRRQAVKASQQSAFHIAVSRFTRDTIARFTGPSDNLRVIPIGVDGSVFGPDSLGYLADQILYVGRIQFVKGIDILLQAMRRLIDWRSGLRLVLVGGSFYGHQRSQEERLRSLVSDFGLEGHVQFVGMKSPLAVAEFMRRSALLVLPSRAEAFGAVLVEALACGTPVVATRCGGPEDIVNEHVGLLVEKEDVEALASGLRHVLEHRAAYDSTLLRTHAIENFDWKLVASQVVNLYNQALNQNSTHGRIR